MKNGMKRWMVVDDTPAVLEAVAMVLESLGRAEVCRFNSADEALEAFAQDCDGFELIVTDLNMPGTDGIEFCQILRQLNPEQIVLLATGSSEITTAEALDAGFNGMLRKPFAVRELLVLLNGVGILPAPERKTVDTVFAVRSSLGLFSAAWA